MVNKHIVATATTQVGGRDVLLRFVNDPEFQLVCFGLWDESAATVTIDSELSMDDLMITLFHELGHAVNNTIGVKESEKTTDLRAHLLYQALKPILSMRLKNIKQHKKRRR